MPQIMRTMKTIMKTFLLTLLFMTVMTSCNKEELFVEPEVEVVEEETDDTEDTDDTETPTEEVDTSAACDFTLDDVQPNSTVIINCVLDLGGGTITLPENVTILYEGGDIINGTINFSGGNVISGELLNSTLIMGGTNPQLKDPVFNFDPKRWGIVEGEVDEPTAYRNHEIIQEVIDLLKSIGVETFALNELDAFFVTYKKQTPVIEMPSNFNFKMSENTHLRMFPVDRDYAPWMIRIQNGNNINISGGFLHGERDQHGPTIATGGALVWISSGVDVIVENVHISEASGTGLTINSFRFADHALYEPSKNVLVRNCIFDSNRSNNLSITDGEDIIVENCKLYRAGIDTPYSLGRAPKIGIVIEPVSGQKVDGVIIRNNILKEGGGKSSILVALGNDVVISGNEADRQVGWTSASNVKVINNPGLRGGVIAGFTSNYALSKSTGNEVSGNTILDASTGIYATNDDIKIFNNTIKNCGLAMQLLSLKDTEIYNNTITSSGSDLGFNVQRFLNNVTIRDNNIEIPKGRSILMSSVNSDSEYENYNFSFKNNTVKTGNPIKINNSNGMDIIGNDFTLSGMLVSNSKNILISSNNVKVDSGSCLHINKTISTQNIEIVSNTFENTNPGKIQGYGLRVSSFGSSVVTENSNILIKENDITVAGQNNGIYVKNIDGLTIKDNNGWLEDFQFIYFRGNNSSITNNNTIVGPEGNDIEGSNNSISGN